MKFSKKFGRTNIYLMTDWQEVKKFMQSLKTVADPV